MNKIFILIDIDVDIKNCLATLKEGGVILYPTDTVWGIGCDATNELAVAKIIALKKRAVNKSFILLVANKNEIYNYVENPNENIFKFLKTTKSPTTAIYDNAKNLAKNMLHSNGSIAIRIVEDEFCKKLIENLGSPIVSTSANISNENTPLNFGDISQKIKSLVDYIVTFRKDEVLNKKPSSLIKWNGFENKIDILR